MASDAGVELGGEADLPLAGLGGAEVEVLLAAQPDRVSGPLLDQAPVVFAIDTGPAGRRTVRAERDGRLLWAPGVVRRPHATIRAGADTLVAMLSGRESGVGTFVGAG